MTEELRNTADVNEIFKMVKRILAASWSLFFDRASLILRWVLVNMPVAVFQAKQRFSAHQNRANL